MLPIIETPKFDLRLPSTSKMVEYRPFLVKEEKILLMAQEGGSSREMITAMKDIVKACTFNAIDPNQLTVYDLEYVFLKLRAKSVGETTQINIKCSECEEVNPIEINIDDIEAPVVDPEPKVIMLTENVGLTMRHIRVRDIAALTDETKKQADVLFDTMIASIDNIFDEKGIYKTDETKKEEMNKFINSLNRKHMNAIQEFIAETPKLEHKVDFVCVKCGHKNEIVLHGVQSFF